MLEDDPCALHVRPAAIPSNFLKYLPLPENPHRQETEPLNHTRHTQQRNMRSLTHLPLPLLALTTTTTTTSRTGAAAQQQQQHPPIRCPASNDATAPDAWPGYVFALRYGLHYEFVSAQAAAAAQLCRAGGSVVDHAVGGGSSGGAQTWGVEAVAPEVAEALGYVAAALVVRAAAGLLAELNEQVGNATSRLYGNPDALARQIAEQIDDAFEVVLSEFCRLSLLLSFGLVVWLTK
ncbi:hypothetical protein B0I37DRAFT_73487 [Chaetomium sp. MPI-CAGE-AT-0009]|nr:hypothetical protein B0I37DRAFT_73487 [Chaetomium sp. MPI-CAGE-AT-0009]